MPAHRACSSRHIDPACLQKRGKVEVNNIPCMNDFLACCTTVSCAFIYCDGCELWVTPSLVKINVQHLPVVILYITKFYCLRFMHLADQSHKQCRYSTTALLPVFFPTETERHKITLSHKVVLHYPEGDILWTKSLSYSEFALGADLACVK